MEENNRIKGLTIDEARALGKLMEHVRYNSAEMLRNRAMLTLGEIKQDFIDDENYEKLVGLKKLEEWHNLAIPFESEEK